MNETIDWPFILTLAIPIILLQFGLQIYALVDLYRANKVRWDNKWIWLAIILFVNLIGPLAYLLAGKQEE